MEELTLVEELYNDVAWTNFILVCVGLVSLINLAISAVVVSVIWRLDK